MALAVAYMVVAQRKPLAQALQLVRCVCHCIVLSHTFPYLIIACAFKHAQTFSSLVSYLKFFQDTTSLASVSASSQTHLPPFPQGCASPGRPQRRLQQSPDRAGKARAGKEQRDWSRGDRACCTCCSAHSGESSSVSTPPVILVLLCTEIICKDDGLKRL